MLWFGESWGAPACDPTDHAMTPVGRHCSRCEVAIVEGDQGFLIPTMTPTAIARNEALSAMHLDCFLRTIGIEDPRAERRAAAAGRQREYASVIEAAAALGEIVEHWEDGDVLVRRPDGVCEVVWAPTTVSPRERIAKLELRLTGLLNARSYARRQVAKAEDQALKLRQAASDALASQGRVTVAVNRGDVVGVFSDEGTARQHVFTLGEVKAPRFVACVVDELARAVDAPSASDRENSAGGSNEA